MSRWCAFFFLLVLRSRSESLPDIDSPNSLNRGYTGSECMLGKIRCAEKVFSPIVEQLGN